MHGTSTGICSLVGIEPSNPTLRENGDAGWVSIISLPWDLKDWFLTMSFCHRHQRRGSQPGTALRTLRGLPSLNVQAAPRPQPTIKLGSLSAPGSRLGAGVASIRWHRHLRITTEGCTRSQWRYWSPGKDEKGFGPMNCLGDLSRSGWMCRSLNFFFFFF